MFSILAKHVDIEPDEKAPVLDRSEISRSSNEKITKFVIKRKQRDNA